MAVDDNSRRVSVACGFRTYQRFLLVDMVVVDRGQRFLGNCNVAGKMDDAQMAMEEAAILCFVLGDGSGPDGAFRFAASQLSRVGQRSFELNVVRIGGDGTTDCDSHFVYLGWRPCAGLFVDRSDPLAHQTVAVSTIPDTNMDS